MPHELFCIGLATWLLNDSQVTQIGRPYQYFDISHIPNVWVKWPRYTANQRGEHF